MNVTMNNTIMKNESSQKFNYSFDYSDYNSSSEIKHEPHVFQPALKAILMIATFVCMIFMTVLLYRRNTGGCRGFRWYAGNLMLINFIVMITIVVNDKDLAFLIKSHLAHSTYSRFKNYNFDIVELSNIGFTNLQWFLISLINDIVPLSFVIIQKEFFPYSVVRPKPYAVYHALLWSLFGLASCLFITSSVCCLKTRKNEAYVAKIEYNPSTANLKKCSTFSREYESAFAHSPQFTFNHRHLIRLSLYLIFTLWIQYPTSWNLGPDLIPVEKIDPDVAMKIMPKVQPFIKFLLNVNIWSTFCMPLVETLACLLFLPSFGDLFCFPSEVTSGSM